MSFSEFLDFSLCDESPFSMPLATDEDLSIGQFLGPFPSEPHWFAGSELSGDNYNSNNYTSNNYTPNNYSSIDLNVLEDQRSTNPTNLDATVWVHELTGSPTGFFAPLASEIVPDVLKPFDGEIPVQDTYSGDIWRYMQRSGKVPNVNVFAPEHDEYVLSLASSLVNNATVINSFGSPLTLPSGSSDAETSTPVKAVATRKRKLNDIDGDEDFNESDNDENPEEFIVVKNERQRHSDSQKWSKVPEKDYSSRRNGNKMVYRCDLCFEQGQKHLCNSQGDMARHLQSEKHSAKAFLCSNSGCPKDYTRKDALKRHMATCKYGKTN